ncbi:MAG: alpha-ketoglutarate-dependent dioxygenase AlkB [Candidatus Babeliales bacterium]
MNIHLKKNIFFPFLLSFTLVCLAHVYTQKNEASSKIIYITETEINAASLQNAHGYVINKPGIYILENVNWNVAKPDNFALTIATDNVQLDGTNTRIKQMDSLIKHAIAIQIQENCKNIQISNVVFDSLSGGGIWCRGNNTNIIIKNCKFTNCGYFGNTQLDSKNLPFNAPRACTQGILFDGGHGKPIVNAQVVDCLFAESGILRTGQQVFESDCGAVLAYHVHDLTIKGCTIDGCVGKNTAYAISLIDISNALVSDIFITDIFSSGHAEGIFAYDVDGQVIDASQTAILSGLPAHKYSYMLDTHDSYKEFVLPDPNYQIEANHLKGIIPKHTQMIETLFNEHKWREFRTLGRLVCHHADKRSETTRIYGKWVELLCERVLNVKVKVVGAFANLYENGNIPLPAHRDQYKKWIIGLSFGGPRTLEFVPDDPRAQIASFVMDSGDVFIFSPDVNNRYQHRMQEEPSSTSRRINLTYFIDILPGQNANNLVHAPNINASIIPTYEEAETLYNLQKGAVI